MSQCQQKVDKRLEEINSFIQQYIHDNTKNDTNIEQHEYVSPIQHHKSSLTLHSIILNEKDNINDFQHLFPNLSTSNIFLKKIVIFQITSQHKEYPHVLDLSPFDLLSHFDKLREVFKKFNASKYDYSISKPLDEDDEYQQYLYSNQYIQDIVKNKSNPDYGLIMTAPSNLHLYINYKYNMVLLPKYYLYNASNDLYCDLDTKTLNTYCRTHTPLFDLQTLSLYLDADIAKKYFKSTLDSLYRIYGFVHNKSMWRFNTPQNIKYNKEIYQPSRIWDTFLFNIHPSMIYINKHINWSAFIQFYIQIFEITTHNINKSSDDVFMNPSDVYFTEKEISHTTLSIKLHSNGYRGGGGDGITDKIQYLPPEYLPDFDPTLIFEHKHKDHIVSAPKVNKMISLSLHGTPISPTEMEEIQEIATLKDYQTEPSPHSKQMYQTEDDDETIRNAFLRLTPKQSTTIFNEYIFENDVDIGAVVLDDDDLRLNDEYKEEEDDDEVPTLSHYMSLPTKTSSGVNNSYNKLKDVVSDHQEEDDDDDTYSLPMFSDHMSLPTKTVNIYNKRKQLKKELKRREDIDYLSCLWSLSGNIFGLGVILFVLLNGYPPFESASVNDRWYKEIIKNKFHKFWKLHRASPINAIPIPSAPTSFTPSTMNVLSPMIVLPPNALNIVQQTSISAQNVFAVSPTSPNTVVKTYRSHAQSVVDYKAGGKRPRIMSESTTLTNVYKKKKKKKKIEYDYRSIQGLMNDLLRYDCCLRLEAFFNYDNEYLSVEYHKYWFLDIQSNNDNDIMEYKYNINENKSESNNLIDRLRYSKQEENGKKSRAQNEDSYVSSCICWMMEKENSDPLYLLNEANAVQLYTVKPWPKVLHSMYHIIQDECHAAVKKEYTKKHKRLISRIKLAQNNQENSHKLIIFEIMIWKSIKWKQLNTKEDIIYCVQWRRLHGNTLDYVRVINRVIHTNCAKLFYLPKRIRNAMKPD